MVVKGFTAQQNTKTFCILRCFCELYRITAEQNFLLMLTDLQVIVSLICIKLNTRFLTFKQY